MAELPHIPGLSDYQRAFTDRWREHWLALMSGGFSIPFVALGFAIPVWFPDRTTAYAAAAVFLLMAFMGAWYAGFVIWRIERERGDDLRGRVTTKFELFFDRPGYPGIAGQTLEIRQDNGLANYYDLPASKFCSHPDVSHPRVRCRSAPKCQINGES
jgi:hypothetical protein